MNLSDWKARLRDRSNAVRGHAPHPLLKVLAWIFAVTVTATLISFVAAAILLNNAAFHGYLIRKAESQAREALGVRVQIRNFAVHLSSLSIEIYGLSVDGASPYSTPPLLVADRVQAGLRIVSILKRSWYLSSFEVDRPVVHVVVDEHGISNLPTLKSSGNSSTSVFDLGIRHALLQQGEIYFNDQPEQVSADVHDLEVKASFDNAAKRYSGKLAYSNGQFVYGSLSPMAHNLEVEFDATPSAFHLARAALSTGNSRLQLSGDLKDYNNPEANGRYDLVLDGKQLGEALRQPAVPTGVLHTAGAIYFRQAPGRPEFEGLAVDGSVDSRGLKIASGAVRLDVTGIDGRYEIAHGDAMLRELRARVAGGAIDAKGTIKDLSGNPHSEFTAEARDISLSEILRALGPAAQTGNARLSGKLNAQARAAWGRNFNDLTARADATLNGQVNRSVPAAAQVASAGGSGSAKPGAAPESFAVESTIHAAYTASSQQVSLNDSYIKTPQTTLTMNGTVSRSSSLNLHLQSGDLREVDAIAEMFRTPAAGQTLQPLGLAGAATFEGSVQGAVSEPHLKGLLTATNLQYNGTSWKAFHSNIDLSPSQLSLQHALLESSSHGSVAFSAMAGLSHWSLTATSPIGIQLNAAALNIADIEKLANRQLPVSGTLNANVSMSGTELHPVGKGTIALTGLIAWDEPITSASLQFSGSGDEVHGNLAIALPSGNIAGSGSVRPREQTYQAQIDATGVQLAKLHALSTGTLKIDGTAALHARGQGSFQNPQLDAALEIPSLNVEGQTMTGFELHADVANHIANATMRSSAVNTSIQSKARVELSGDYLADASLDTQDIPLAPLLAAYAPQADGVTGKTEIHATLKGPLRNKNKLEAHVRVPVLSLAYGGTVALAATAPILVDYKDGAVTVQRSFIRGTDADLEFAGTIPLNGTGAAAVMLTGTVDLAMAQLFDQDIRSSGKLKLNIDSHGPFNRSAIAGTVDVVDANFASNDLPVGLQHCNGVLQLTPDRLNIGSLRGSLGGGTVTAQGGIVYRPAVQFDLGMSASGARILYPQGMRENVDADLRLSGTTETAVLGGSVHLSDLSFSPGFELGTFVGQFGSGVAAPPSRGFAQNVQLNLAVDSTSNVNLTSRALSLGGSANLQVRGTAAEPVLLGRVNLDKGDIILNGNRYVLNGGTIQFVNPYETQPVVNVSLTTSIQQYSIDLRFHGPVDKLKTQYSSDPALPVADIINLLAFGQTTEASNASQTPANQAAESLVASQVSSQITSRVSKIAGISQLSINPVLAGSSSAGPPGANITIQQRVTGNLFVTFSTNVASTQSQTVQGQYQMSPRVAFSATRDPNGGFGFDTLIKKSW